ncbi:TPA: YfhO family protein [Streptococcus mutans]|uniref:glycosyltransferase PgfM2 n=1 Tax=Streptococcus mutans TaxID=1309 RepID=UPI0002B580D2|nr:YfhO family protein [Streptococcus mutans]EMB73534.1 putative transmembrane protein [Streptococcus mutans 4VF1]EMC31765.1 putative transmembrane protein [Streptococcus mutans NLML1]MCB5097613.1 YfhO family protein [Streptococcus mutans]
MVSREEKDNKAVNEGTQDMRQEPLEHFSRSRAHRSQARHQETVASEKEEQKNTEKAPFKNTLGFLAAFCLPMLVMAVVFAVMKLYPFGKETLMSGDYTLQYIPLYRALGHAFRHMDIGALFWSWHKGVGGVMPSVWGFNSLSPFSLAIGLAPAKYLNLSVFLVTLLRQGFSGLSFYYFLHKRYEAHRHRLLAVCIAAIYGLSGFLIVNQVNPNFLDNIILLPLLLIGVEKILDGKVSIKYTLVLALMFVVQFYTAYMACIFVIFYSFYYILAQKSAFLFKAKQLLRLLIYSLLGIGLSAIWLLPVFYSLLDTKAAGGEVDPWAFTFLYNPIRLLIKFFPGAASGEEWGDFTALPNFYVGVLGFIGLFNFFFTKRIALRKKISGFLLLIFLILAFSNAAAIRFWHMGQMPVGFYYRNAWLLSPVFLILTYQALQKVKSWSRLQMIATFILALLANVYVYFAVKEKTYTLVTVWQELGMIITLILLLFLIWFQLSKSWQLAFVILVSMVDMGINAKITIDRNLWHSPSSVLAAESKQEAFYKNLKLPKSGLARLEKSSANTWNDSLTYNYYGVNHFTSSVEYKNLEFLGRLGLPSSTAISMYVGGTPLTDALVNLRYYVDNATWTYSARKDLANYYHPIQTLGNAKLLENTSVFGLGFSGDGAMLREKLDKEDVVANQNQIYHGLSDNLENLLDPYQAANLSLDNVALADNANGQQIYKRQSSDRPGTIRLTWTPQDNNSYYLYSSQIHSTDLNHLKFTLNGQAYTVFDRYRNPQLWNLASNSKDQEQTFEISLTDNSSLNLTGLQLYRFNDDSFTNFVKQGHIAKWNPEKVTSLSLSGEVKQVSGKNYLFTSIPYNAGWHVKVDGKTLKTQEVWNAMLAFKLPSGKHQIKLYYIPQGLIYGSLITLLSLIFVISILRKSRQLRKKQEEEREPI